MTTSFNILHELLESHITHYFTQQWHPDNLCLEVIRFKIFPSDQTGIQSKDENMKL
jgi:hypothetical protein